MLHARTSSQALSTQHTHSLSPNQMPLTHIRMGTAAVTPHNTHDVLNRCMLEAALMKPLLSHGHAYALVSMRTSQIYAALWLTHEHRLTLGHSDDCVLAWVVRLNLICNVSTSPCSLADRFCHCTYREPQ